MTEDEKQEYDSALSLYQAEKKREPKMSAEDREYWNKVKVDYEMCPYRDPDLHCKWSKKFRKNGR
jgi:hypothetical protein